MGTYEIPESLKDMFNFNKRLTKKGKKTEEKDSSDEFEKESKSESSWTKVKHSKLKSNPGEKVTVNKVKIKDMTAEQKKDYHKNKYAQKNVQDLGKESEPPLKKSKMTPDEKKAKAAERKRKSRTAQSDEKKEEAKAEEKARKARNSLRTRNKKLKIRKKLLWPKLGLQNVQKLKARRP